MKNWFGTGLELYFEFQIGLDIIQNYKITKLQNYVFLQNLRYKSLKFIDI